MEGRSSSRERGGLTADYRISMREVSGQWRITSYELKRSWRPWARPLLERDLWSRLLRLLGLGGLVVIAAAAGPEAGLSGR
jgi:hypothetical protein